MAEVLVIANFSPVPSTKAPLADFFFVLAIQHFPRRLFINGLERPKEEEQNFWHFHGIHVRTAGVTIGRTSGIQAVGKDAVYFAKTYRSGKTSCTFMASMSEPAVSL